MENNSEVECSCSLININYKGNPLGLIKTEHHPANYRATVSHLNKPGKPKISLSRSTSGLYQQDHGYLPQKDKESLHKRNNVQIYQKQNIYVNSLKKSADIKKNQNYKLKKKYINNTLNKFKDRTDYERTKNTTVENSYENSNSKLERHSSSVHELSFSFINKRRERQSMCQSQYPHRFQISHVYQYDMNEQIDNEQLKKKSFVSSFSEMRRIKTLKQMQHKNIEQSIGHQSSNNVSVIINSDQDLRLLEDITINSKSLKRILKQQN